MKAQKLTPDVKWSQQANKISLKIMLRDIIDESVQILQDKVSFSGTSNGKEYQFELNLYKKINQSSSKILKTGACLSIDLMKNQGNQKWPRLTADPQKLSFVSIDWDRWEDHSHEQENSNDEQDSHIENYSNVKKKQSDGFGDIENAENGGEMDYQEYDQGYENSKNE